MRNTTFSISLVLVLLAPLNVCQASTPTVLYNFCSLPNCADGANPVADLVLDGNHNLWGTAKNGGKNGFGTVFELTLSSGYTMLGQVYSFRGGSSDGAYPVAGLVYDSQLGELFGTTSAGGKGACSNGCGTVFSFRPGSSSDQILHFFGASGDGATPKAELLEDASRNFYGTTSVGGSGDCDGGCGTVFVVNPIQNTYSVLHRFSGTSDGANPVAAMIFDSQGNLWGDAKQGGADGFGTIFELAAPNFGTIEYVHSFRGKPNGANPAGALTFDPTVGGTLGTLYGTTSAGGTGPCQPGCGIAFELELPATGSVKNIYSFTGVGSDESGSAPVGRLTLDTSDQSHLGHLYGTASLGGIDSGSCGDAGCGTAFEICPPTRTCSFRESTLVHFDGKDGQNPLAGTLIDVTLLDEDDQQRKIKPPTGSRGACTTNCVATAQSGGSNGEGVVVGITP